MLHQFLTSGDLAMRYMRTLFYTAFCILLSIVVSAQYNHQFIIRSDNDGYTSINNDGYYTNGLYVAYQWRKTDSLKKSVERINSFEAGNNIYTSRFSGEFYEKNLDRPLTGYMYAGFRQTLINRKEGVIQWGINAGTVGAWAYGKEIQTFAHKLMQVYKPTYWDHQLHSAFGLNASFLWSPNAASTEQLNWELKPILTGTLGTLFTNAGCGAALLFGRYHKNSASVFWDNHKGLGKSNREFFGYLFPTFYYKLYDATVQGGMSNTVPEMIEGKLNHYYLQAKLGGMYASNRMSFGAAIIYESKQSLTQRDPQYYGSLQVGWRW